MENVEEVVEGAVEIVEEVAEVVEKVSSEVGDSITKDGILKDAVSWVEKASKEVKDFARQTLGFFHKVLSIYFCFRDLYIKSSGLDFFINNIKLC